VLLCHVDFEAFPALAQLMEIAQDHRFQQRLKLDLGEHAVKRALRFGLIEPLERSAQVSHARWQAALLLIARGLIDLGNLRVAAMNGRTLMLLHASVLTEAFIWGGFILWPLGGAQPPVLIQLPQLL
jgi:hypothetical protein